MVKLLNSLLEELVIYHGIQVGGLEFEPVFALPPI